MWCTAWPTTGVHQYELLDGVVGKCLAGDLLLLCDGMRDSSRIPAVLVEDVVVWFRIERTDQHDQVDSVPRPVQVKPGHDIGTSQQILAKGTFTFLWRFNFLTEKCIN